jgi:soluble lytic murein transglycosylase-like protein
MLCVFAGDMRCERALRPRLWIAALLLPAALGFSPSHPFGGDLETAPDLIASSEAKRIHRVFQIYSILRPEMSALPHGKLWQLAGVIERESAAHGIDPFLVVALIRVESNFQPTAVSSAGARGLMQILPFVGKARAEEIAPEKWLSPASLHDPVLNVRLGVAYLAELKARFRNLRTALAAYRWGPATVRSLVDNDEPLPEAYVQRVLLSYRDYRRRSIAAPQAPLALLLDGRGAEPGRSEVL